MRVGESLRNGERRDSTCARESLCERERMCVDIVLCTSPHTFVLPGSIPPCFLFISKHTVALRAFLLDCLMDWHIQREEVKGNKLLCTICRRSLKGKSAIGNCSSVNMCKHTYSCSYTLHICMYVCINACYLSCTFIKRRTCTRTRTSHASVSEYSSSVNAPVLQSASQYKCLCVCRLFGFSTLWNLDL